MRTWERSHPDWEYIVWDEAAIRDLGITNADRFEELLDAGVYDAASDVARIEILYALGGVYVDCDSVCLRPMDGAPFLDAGFFATREIPPRGSYLVTNSFMGCVPAHPLASRYIQHIGHAKMRCVHGRTGAAFCCAWRLTGPQALTGLIRRARMADVMVLEPWAFFTRTIKGVPVPGHGWGEHFWSSTGERSPDGEFPGAVSYEEVR